MNWYLVLAIVATAFVLWAMVDISHKNIKPIEKIAWFAVAVFFPIVGPAIYFFTAHKK